MYSGKLRCLVAWEIASWRLTIRFPNPVWKNILFWLLGAQPEVPTSRTWSSKLVLNKNVFKFVFLLLSEATKYVFDFQPRWTHWNFSSGLPPFIKASLSRSAAQAGLGRHGRRRLRRRRVAYPYARQSLCGRKYFCVQKCKDCAHHGMREGTGLEILEINRTQRH